MGNEDNRNLTIADVAEALGVSKTTVSRAISGKGRIGVATRDRVLKYIEEHYYKPNVIAKGLAQSKTYNLCVVMPADYAVVDLTFFQECLLGIQEIAGIMEYDILLSICKNDDIASLERIVMNHKVDGVILMRTFVEDKQIEYLRGRAADCGQRLLADEISDYHAVHGVVQLLKNVADQKRNGERDQAPEDASLGHVGVRPPQTRLQSDHHQLSFFLAAGQQPAALFVYYHIPAPERKPPTRKCEALSTFSCEFRVDFCRKCCTIEAREKRLRTADKIRKGNRHGIGSGAL